jgi:type IV pilus assembly protein PilM
MHASLVPQEILTATDDPGQKAVDAGRVGGAGDRHERPLCVHQQSWATTHEDLWSKPQAEVTRTKQYSDELLGTDADLDSKLTYLNEMGKEVSGNSESRLKWLEILKVVNETIPRVDFPDGKVLGPKELPYLDRKDIHVTQMETKYYADLTTWFTEKLAKRYRDEIRSWARITNNQNDPVGVGRQRWHRPRTVGSGLGHRTALLHYYNSPERIGFEGSNHVRNVMTTAFLKNEVQVPVGVDADGKKKFETFTMAEMGLKYPLLLDDNKDKLIAIPNPDYDPEAVVAAQMNRAAGNAPAADTKIEPPTLQVRRLDFVFQLVWQETVLSERLEAKEAAREAAEQEAAQAAGESVAALP